MKLSLFSFSFSLLSIPAAAQGTIGSQGCPNATQEVFDANPNLGPAEEAYIAEVAGVLKANCLSGIDLKECNIALGPSDSGDTYAEECTTFGGKMWKYDYSPLCNESDVSMGITGVLVCASANCTSGGAQILIPDPGLLDPYDAVNYTCGTAVSNFREYSSAPRVGLVAAMAVAFGTMTIIM